MPSPRAAAGRFTAACHAAEAQKHLSDFNPNIVMSQIAGSATSGCVGAWVRLGGVWLRVGVGDGVEEARIAAEGAEDVGGGFVAAEEVHAGAVLRGVLDR